MEPIHHNSFHPLPNTVPLNVEENRVAIHNNPQPPFAQAPERVQVQRNRNFENFLNVAIFGTWCLNIFGRGLLAHNEWVDFGIRTALTLVTVGIYLDYWHHVQQ